MAKYMCIVLAICAAIGLASSQNCTSVVLDNLEATMKNCTNESVPASLCGDPGTKCIQEILKAVNETSPCKYTYVGNDMFNCLVRNKVPNNIAVLPDNCIGNAISYGECCE